jgi:hypothetical protein
LFISFTPTLFRLITSCGVGSSASTDVPSRSAITPDAEKKARVEILKDI